MMTQYIQKGNYEITELDGEWIILNTDEYTITKLNDVGGYCWSILKKAQTADTLTKTLVEKFSVHENQEQVNRDTKDFLESLVECGLIQYVD